MQQCRRSSIWHVDYRRILLRLAYTEVTFRRKKPDMMAQRTSRPSSIFSSYLNNVNLVARTLSLNAYHIVNAVIGKKKAPKLRNKPLCHPVPTCQINELGQCRLFITQLASLTQGVCHVLSLKPTASLGE